MIEAVIGLLELFISQRRDDGRITAGIEAVAGIREQQRKHFVFRELIDAAHCALHLIEHNALIAECAVLILFDVPALLIEDIGILKDCRCKDRVEIDLGQIKKIAQIAARNRIHGLIREGHRIEKGVHRAFEQLNKRLADRILRGAAEDRVLQNMENAGAVLRQRFKGNGKQLVFQPVINPDKLCAGLFKCHFDDSAVQLLRFADARDGKAMQFLSDFFQH